MAEAWITLATNDTYAMSALVLAESLNRVQTTKPKVIMITQDVSPSMQSLLRESFDDVVTVNVIDSKDEQILAVMKRPELGVTLTKIHCWSLTQYRKCVFLDADTLLIQNSDELFERSELSAAPDVGWPDCFNSGVFVFEPSQQTFNALIQLMMREGSFDGGDQGLLNSYFSDWFQSDSSKHLSFKYNMTLVAAYSYPPAYKKFGKDVKIVHFIGSTKPWHYGFNPSTQSVIQPPGHKTLPGKLQVSPNTRSHELPSSEPSIERAAPHERVILGMNLTQRSEEGKTMSSSPDTVSVFSTEPAVTVLSDSAVQVSDATSGHPVPLIDDPVPVPLPTSSSTPTPSSSPDESIGKKELYHMTRYSRSLPPILLEPAIEPMTKVDGPEKCTICSETFSLPKTVQQVEHVQHWWNLFASGVQPKLDTTCSGICAHLAQLDLSQGSSESYTGVSQTDDSLSQQSATSTGSLSRRRMWESGQIDYLGEDAFENIQKKLDDKLAI